MNWSLSDPAIFVVSATTGAKGAAISLPFPAADLTSVATGDGQTFVVAATHQGSCSTSLYRFSLSADGTPSALTAFTTVGGQISDPWAMAVSAGGQIIAYVAAACADGQSQQPSPTDRQAQAYLSVVNSVTGQTKQWTFQESLGGGDPGTGNVSISADGSVVGFGNLVLDTSAAPGSLAARGRVVVQPGEFGTSVELDGLNVAPDGKTAYFGTSAVASNKPVGDSWQLRSVDLATGQTQLVRSFPGDTGSPAAVTFDPTGRYLLAEAVIPTVPAAQLAVLNLATGQLTQLNVPWMRQDDLEFAW